MTPHFISKLESDYFNQFHEEENTSYHNGILYLTHRSKDTIRLQKDALKRGYAITKDEIVHQILKGGGLDEYNNLIEYVKIFYYGLEDKS